MVLGGILEPSSEIQGHHFGASFRSKTAHRICTTFLDPLRHCWSPGPAWIGFSPTRGVQIPKVASSDSKLFLARTNSKSYSYVLVGTILFLISDFILALDKFVWDIPYDAIGVMTTYMGAQVLIIEGILQAK